MTDTLILRNGRFLEPATEQVTDGDMLIVDGVIETLGTAVTEADRIHTITELAEADPDIARQQKNENIVREINLNGATVIPGLLDMHFHAYAHALGGMELETKKLSYVAINAANRLIRALRRGFTTVRDVAGGDIGLAQAIDKGLVIAPRYLYSGPSLSQTGGHGDPRDADLDLCHSHGHIGEIVDGVDDIRRAVRERFRTGASHIKIMASGGVVSPSDPLMISQYSPEEISAAADEAARRGSYVAAHAYAAEAVVHAVSNGVRTIEHGNLIDEQAARVMKDAGAYLVPTLVAYDAMNRRGHEVGMTEAGFAKNTEVLEAGKNAVALAAEVGVKIGFGSDLMGDLEDDQLHGIALQSEAQDAAALLRSLTVVNAEIIGRSDLGTLAIGTPADLLVLDADPLSDVSVLWDETCSRTVIQAGKVVD